MFIFYSASFPNLGWNLSCRAGRENIVWRLDSPCFFALFILKQTFDTQEKRIQPGLTDISLLVLVLYIFVHLLLIRPVHLHPFFIAETLTLIGLYLLIRLLPISIILWIFIALLLTAFGQSLWGLLQYFTFLPSLHHEFNITGTFFNPAPYSGYIAAIIPVNIGILIFMFSNKNGTNELFTKWKATLQYILIGILCLCILMLILAQSRAAWLAVAFSSAFLILTTFHRLHVWLKHAVKTKESKSLSLHPKIPLGDFFNSLPKLFLTVSILAIIGFLACYKLYQLRTESVDGRLLVWKSTCLMIGNNPITGVGAGQFNSNYMHFQTRVLSNNPNSDWQMLADNTIFAFNEFLRITAEYGLPGLLLSLVVMISIFRRKNNPKHWETNIAIAGIVSILVFGCFSYPSSVLPLKVLLMLFMGIVANLQKPVWVKWPESSKYRRNHGCISKTTAVLVVILFLVFSFQWVYQLTGAVNDWKTASRKFRDDDTEKSLALCAKIYPLLKTDGFFMAMYGHFLKRAERYNEAENILTEAAKVQPTSDIYLNLGDCYKQQNRYKLSEKAFQYALKMVPSRIKPVRALAELYLQTGRETEAVRIIEVYLKRKVNKRTIASYQIELALTKMYKKIKPKE